MAQDAYDRGREDYARGYIPSDNPFVPLTGDWNDWKLGFKDALEEDAELPGPEDK